MHITATGSLLSNLFFGDKKLLDWLVPWTITLDTEAEHIIVSKRNYYFIGVDREVIPFRNVRKVTLDTHLFGADIRMKVYGGAVKARCLKKKEAEKIYNYCLEEITSNKRSRRFS